ncbi:MAG TPA: cell division protein ZapA [bacterium]|jgi:cell division protein ZapA (FtsZ GTPase activity inhibitor)|nr:cell division protein ZapA [bacterium]
MAIETVRVELLGASFTIQTDESKDYVESLIAYLRSKVETVKATARVDDPLKVSILAAIFLVDELYRERLDASARSGAPETEVDLGSVAERLISRIDASLSRTGGET